MAVDRCGRHAHGGGQGLDVAGAEADMPLLAVAEPSGRGFYPLEQAPVAQQVVVCVYRQLVTGAGDAIDSAVMEDLQVGDVVNL